MLLDEDKKVKVKILNAIMDDPEIVTLLKEKYIDDDVWKFCIEREPSIFKKMKHPSFDICMYACEVDGSNLRYIKNKFKYIEITDIMAYTAVKSNPKAILSVPKKLLTESLKELAFEEDPSLMENFDEIRPEFIEKIIWDKPYAIKYIKHITPDIEDLICEVIKKNPIIASCVNRLSDRMLITLKTFHPNHFHLYVNGNSNLMN